VRKAGEIGGGWGQTPAPPSPAREAREARYTAETRDARAIPEPTVSSSSTRSYSPPSEADL
jgi:hypothetical protein